MKDNITSWKLAVVVTLDGVEDDALKFIREEMIKQNGSPNSLKLFYIKMKTLKEIMIDYKEFLNRIPESLDWIEKNVIKGTLSYSLDEIEKVHLFYENRLRDFLDVEHLKKVFIAYMGEAFIKHFGGNWELSKIKNDEAYGTAIINNWGSDEGPHVTISPYVWTEIIRKRGKMERTVRQIFEGNIKRFKTNNLT